MKKLVRAFAHLLCLSFLLPAQVRAATLGPASSYDELLALADAASDGDVLLVAGSLLAGEDAPLGTRAAVNIRSSDGTRAVIRALRLVDARVGFEEIDLEDTLRIEGASDVYIAPSVAVRGADGREGILFDGSGTLLIDSGADVSGGRGSAGISVRHESGELYIDIEGDVRGGDGETGGPGVEIAELSGGGALMVAGDIRGGDGETLGGHALNLYGLSGNAFVTLDGSISGGSGHVGGNGVQIVSATDSAVVGVVGSVTGGQGEAFGGDALMLMNVEGGSAVSLSGALRGGDVTAPDAHPGTSLLVVGDATSSHTRVEGCLLEDGRRLAVAAVATPTPEAAPKPEATPKPEIVPETPVPETPVPETPVPETPVPETPVPETPVPETPVPETPVPETPVPVTPVPETPVPETPVPVTPVPVTPVPGASFPATAPEALPAAAQGAEGGGA